MVVLEVPDGLAVMVSAGRDTVLVDGGRGPTAAGRELADLGVRGLDLAIATHTDIDHIEGLIPVLRDVNLSPLLGRARQSGVAVRPVARGSVLAAGETRVEVLWPPATKPPRAENERSLVVRVRVADDQSVIVPADIGAVTERRLASRSPLSTDVLVAPRVDILVHRSSLRTVLPY